MSRTANHGRFVWHDLMSTDPAAAKSFYTQLIGWTLSPWEGSDPHYDMWVNGEKPMGGCMQLPAEAAAMGAPSHWLAYVQVDDIDATTAQAVALGGKVLVPATAMPEVGTFSILQDPQGGVIAAFVPLNDSPNDDGPTPIGQVSWRELATTDYGAATAFYEALFGWAKTDAMDMGPMGIYQMFGRGAGSLGGIFNKSPEMPACAWLYYIRVADCAASVAQAQSLGATLINGPMQVPGGDWVAQLMDPTGAAFAVHTVTPA